MFNERYLNVLYPVMSGFDSFQPFVTLLRPNKNQKLSFNVQEQPRSSRNGQRRGIRRKNIEIFTRAKSCLWLVHIHASKAKKSQLFSY
jgi:hypothetical protein